MGTSTQLASRLWHRLWHQAGGTRAQILIPVESGGDPDRLEPSARSFVPAGSVPVVVLRGEDVGGHAPLGLAPGTLRAVTLAPLAVGIRVALPEGTYSVDRIERTGPGRCFRILHCIAVAGGSNP
ncbi:MAG TPA: hypothetical protein VEI97_14285 [bacterium]|nr:hypothetical protein [bacterium]